MSTSSAGWHPDPLQHHQYRYWSGSEWTEHVSDGGTVSVDPISAPHPKPETAPHPLPHGSPLPAPTFTAVAPHVDPTPTYATPAPTPAASAPAAAGVPARHRRGWTYIAIAAVAGLAIGGVAVFVTRDGNDGSTSSVEVTGGATTNEGGTVGDSDGLGVSVPAGAIPADRNGESADVLVSIARATDLPPVDTSTLSATTSVSSTVYEFGPEGQTFAVPVEVSIPLPPDISADEVQGIAYIDRATNQWVPLRGYVDGNVVRAPMNHFTFMAPWGDTRPDRSTWEASNGGWFEISNPRPTNNFGPSAFFGYAQGAKYSSMSRTYGICIASFNLDDPNLNDEVRSYAVNDMMLTVWADARYSNSGGTKKFWVPAGSYQITEVWFGSEINPGDPLYIPQYGNASRVVTTPVQITKGGTVAYAGASAAIDASTGWTPTRPTCAGVVNPSLGHGAIQVTLDWPETSIDLDLHVVDPQGNEIYYNNPTSPTGGTLDWDNQYGASQPENVFWGTNPPKGTYKVSVVYYSGSAPATWSVRTVVNGTVQTFRGTITSTTGSVDVTTFSVN